MNLKEVCRKLAEPTRTNYCVVGAGGQGLQLLLLKVLAPIAKPEDVLFFNAADILKERARQIEKEARFAPRAGSKWTQFYVYNLDQLPVDSAGPLLKAVEEARYARFIFQTSTVTRKIRTLVSRSAVLQVPFMSRKTVLATMQSLHLDAQSADQLGLYDGTLGGTIRKLQYREMVAQIRRDLTQGMRGIPALFEPETLGSLAFDDGTEGIFTAAERQFLGKRATPERKKIALFLALRRIP